MATMNVRGHKQEEGSQAKPPLQQAQQVHWAQKARERGGDSPDSPRARKHTLYHMAYFTGQCAGYANDHGLCP